LKQRVGQIFGGQLFRVLEFEELVATMPSHVNQQVRLTIGQQLT